MGSYFLFFFFYNIRGATTTDQLQLITHEDSLKTILVFCWSHYFYARYLRIFTTVVYEESTQRPYSDRTLMTGSGHRKV